MLTESNSATISIAVFFLAIFLSAINCWEFLFNDMERCAEMGRAGRKKVSKLNDPSRVADDHVAFYNEIRWPLLSLAASGKYELGWRFS